MRHKVESGFLKLADKKQRKFNKQLEKRLDSIADEAGEFRSSISELAHHIQASERGPEQETPIPAGMLERISNAFGANDKNAALMIYHIGTSNNHWLTQDDLEERTGLSAGVIDEVAGRQSGLILKGFSHLGITVYSLAISQFGFLTAPYYF